MRFQHLAFQIPNSMVGVGLTAFCWCWAAITYCWSCVTPQTPAPLVTVVCSTHLGCELGLPSSLHRAFCSGLILGGGGERAHGRTHI